MNLLVRRSKEAGLPTNPIRVAFVGAGNIAGLHLQALRRVPIRHTVVGVCDASPDRARALASRATAVAYGDLATLLAEARPDLVHVCTPAGTHFEAARQALLAGAHVYVEKPFVETRAEAEALFQVAAARHRLICAGHQLIRDPAFVGVLARVTDLMPVALVDSLFTFKPPRLQLHRASPRALADQLLDVLPHPLYTLVVTLERCAADLEPLEVLFVSATPVELHALFRAGSVVGRLVVSLRARPVASALTLTGAGGTLTCDFMRSIVLGSANEGTAPLEKVANPLLEGARLAWRSAASLARRLRQRGDYPGLAELLEAFYGAVASSAPSPLSVDHLRRVTGLYETLADHVRGSIAPAARPASAALLSTAGGGDAPIAVLTGASGFFGTAIARELASRGFRVRGAGRSRRSHDPNVHEWVRADLGEGVPAELLVDAAVVVHAAAETDGGFDAHQRNTVDATRNLLRAMSDCGVRRMVHISTISVLRPPTSPWEVQAEGTAMPKHAAELGAYTWGKCEAEALVAGAQTQGRIDARIIRPGALIEWEHIEFPGLLGRRLFGKWYLGCGRPGLPLAICEVGRAAAAVAWCADHFADAPPTVNLFDPAVHTRRQLLNLFHEHGWRGRVIWVPIGLLAGAVMVARQVAALARRERARPLAVWSVLRPRRYDPAVATNVLAAAAEDTPPVKRVVRASTAASVSQACG